MTRRCDGCHAEISRYATDPLCPTCYASRNRPAATMPQRGLPPAIWLWSSSEAAQALATRDLAVILRTYRQLNKLSQDKLAALLGYDKTYISMIETGRRVINDVATRRHIADTLALPAHALGDPGDLGVAGTPPAAAPPGRVDHLRPDLGPPPDDRCWLNRDPSFAALLADTKAGRFCG